MHQTMTSGLYTNNPLYRLCGKELAGPLVAPRRLAIPPLLLCVWRHRLLMATIGQQQQMSPPPLLYPSFLVLIIGLDIHIIDVGRIGTRR